MPSVESFTFRPRQNDAKIAVFKSHSDGYQNVLVSSPTGFGKTILAGGMVNQLLTWNKRIFMIAHRDTLLEQAESKIKYILERMGTDPKKVAIVNTERESAKYPVAICSIQKSTNWYEGLKNRQYCIVDEAHHACAKSYRNFYNSFNEANPKWHGVGVTATAYRSDSSRLADIYQKIAYHVDLTTLIYEGMLSPLRARHIELDVRINTAAIKKKAPQQYLWVKNLLFVRTA